MELPRSTDKVGTQQCRGVVGLPMMVLAQVIGKGSGNDNEGGASIKPTTTTMVGLMVVWCIEKVR